MKLKYVLIGIMMISSAAFSSVGAARTEGVDVFSIDEALTYSIEDELLAKEEYEKIIEEYGGIRPFINIVEAEKQHIMYLEPLLKKYNVEYPGISEEDVVLPKTLVEAYEIGVKAEVDNINMYEKFLENDLPEDIKDVFIRLKNASENHLKAFERQLERSKNN